jgi:hypothetical protein
MHVELMRGVLHAGSLIRGSASLACMHSQGYGVSLGFSAGLLLRFTPMTTEKGWLLADIVSSSLCGEGQLQLLCVCWQGCVMLMKFAAAAAARCCSSPSPA